MSNQNIREGFNQMINAAQRAGDADAVAKLEIAREYFTNPAFRKNLEDVTWQINQGK
jgi:hypothetical protein